MSFALKAKPFVVLAGFTVLITAALAAASMLFVDYARPAAVFCAEGAGCTALRHSHYARLAGVPLPFLGLLGFSLLALLALLPGAVVRKVFAIAAALGASFALYLVFVQILLRTFCVFCLVVDVSSLLLAGLAVWRLRRGWDPPGSRAVTLAAIPMATAVALPVGYALLSPSSSPKAPPIDVPAIVPAPIRAEMAATPPGVVTVIDFADFECPWCRALHAELGSFLDDHPGKVRLVRKHVPLARLHPHARDAARGGICGERQGKGEAMADALFSAAPEDLTPKGMEVLAQRVGLDVEVFRACLFDPATDAKIEADLAAFEAAGNGGLPTLWFGEERLVGARPREQLEAAYRRALSRLTAK